MKNTKVIQGWYCTKCNKRIPEAQQATLRVIRTGVCSKCANEYSGAIQFMLLPGMNICEMKTEPAHEGTRAIISPVGKIISEHRLTREIIA